MSRCKTKPRATFSPGHEPVKFQCNYCQVQGRSQCYFEEVPRPRPPRHFSYRKTWAAVAAKAVMEHARIQRDHSSCQNGPEHKTPGHLQPGAVNLPSYSNDYRQL